MVELARISPLEFFENREVIAEHEAATRVGARRERG